MNNPTRYELMSSIASRKKQMETIQESIGSYEGKIKQLKNRLSELESLNYLDQVLLNEITK